MSSTTGIDSQKNSWNVDGSTARTTKGVDVDGLPSSLPTADNSSNYNNDRVIELLVRPVYDRSFRATNTNNPANGEDHCIDRTSSEGTKRHKHRDGTGGIVIGRRYPLPIRLGRVHLTRLWWRQCPEPTGLYRRCMIPSLCSFRGKQNCIKRHSESLSKHSIECNASGRKINIVAKHPELFHIETQELQHVELQSNEQQNILESYRLRIGSPSKDGFEDNRNVWMQFDLQFLTIDRRNYNENQTTIATATSSSSKVKSCSPPSTTMPTPSNVSTATRSIAAWSPPGSKRTRKRESCVESDHHTFCHADSRGDGDAVRMAQETQSVSYVSKWLKVRNEKRNRRGLTKKRFWMLYKDDDDDDDDEDNDEINDTKGCDRKSQGNDSHADDWLVSPLISKQPSLQKRQGKRQKTDHNVLPSDYKCSVNDDVTNDMKIDRLSNREMQSAASTQQQQNTMDNNPGIDVAAEDDDNSITMSSFREIHARTPNENKKQHFVTPKTTTTTTTTTTSRTNMTSSKSTNSNLYLATKSDTATVDTSTLYSPSSTQQTFVADNTTNATIRKRNPIVLTVQNDSMKNNRTPADASTRDNNNGCGNLHKDHDDAEYQSLLEKDDNARKSYVQKEMQHTPPVRRKLVFEPASCTKQDGESQLGDASVSCHQPPHPHHPLHHTLTTRCSESTIDRYLAEKTETNVNYSVGGSSSVQAHADSKNKYQPQYQHQHPQAYTMSQPFLSIAETQQSSSSNSFASSTAGAGSPSMQEATQPLFSIGRQQKHSNAAMPNNDNDAIDVDKGGNKEPSKITSKEWRLMTLADWKEIREKAPPNSFRNAMADMIICKREKEGVGGSSHWLPSLMQAIETDDKLDSIHDG